MKITVFGARDELGHLVISEALARGWDVVAFVRNRSTIQISNPRLRVVSGSLEDEADVEKAVKASKAVICLLIPAGRTRRMPVSKAVTGIIAAMQKNRVKRLVCLTTVSIKHPKDRFSLPFRLAVWMRRATVPYVYADAVRTVTYVGESGLIWTIVRIAGLKRDPSGRQMNVGYLGEVRYASAAVVDLARFLVQQVGDEQYVEESPVVAN